MIIEHFEVKGVCVDVGYGVYIVEGLAHINGDFELHGINFGAGTTKERVEKTTTQQNMGQISVLKCTLTYKKTLITEIYFSLKKYMKKL